LNRDQIEAGIDQVLNALRGYALDSGEHVLLNTRDVYELEEAYCELFYLAMLGSVKSSLTAIKKRLASGRQTRFMIIDRPFFDIEILLVVCVYTYIYMYMYI